ncbi:OmpA family protein [Sphingomonas profundi]|uniref:OmpA family protein n=1 Tax=Alterirhizorhabdus profundi TaxID=2681549 RepID=UPI0012E84FD8|nr:OmpA family protein [Sphingomonas profundi]
MSLRHTLATATAAAALLSATACTTDPETGQQRLSKAAIGAGVGVLGGYLAGDIVGGRRDRTEKIVGAGIGAIAGGAIGAYMDRQERELRQKTAGTGIEVERKGDDILLNIPSGVTFATNSAAIQPQFRQTLDQVAETLSTYNQTYLDVYGHTDSTGSDRINLPLSRDRATAVADYLATRGVQRARIGTEGFGASQPVASNATAEGRQENRRVEIKIVPVSTTAA